MRPGWKHRRRGLVATALLALALAPAAAASTPGMPTVTNPTPGVGASGVPTVTSGSVLGEGVPLKAYASLSPLVHLFGDSVTAEVDVIADTKWVDPSRIHVDATFGPYLPVVPVSIVQTGTGRFVTMTWRWSLRCLRSRCVPRNPPSDTEHVFHFRPARIEYLAQDGTAAYGLNAGFPPVEELSQISPGSVGYLESHKQLLWRFKLAPVAAAHYRVSPSTLFWLAVALGLLFVAGGLGIAGRWALSFRPGGAGDARGTTLDRALAVFFWARERGDETLQRKALERVAGELDLSDVHELSAETRALAWSPEAPDDDHVEAISERAHAQEEAP